MAFCNNDILAHKEGRKILMDFRFNPLKDSDPTVTYLINDQFPNAIPTYDEFIKNPKVKEVLGILPKNQIKEYLGIDYTRPSLSDTGIILFRKKISSKNNDLKRTGQELQLRSFNVQQKGQSDIYSYGLRVIKKSINIDAKIEKVTNELAVESNNELEKIDNLVNLLEIQQQVGKSTDLFSESEYQGENENLKNINFDEVKKNSKFQNSDVVFEKGMRSFDDLLEIQNGNQYFINGSVYSSYEDAKKAFQDDNEENSIQYNKAEQEISDRLGNFLGKLNVGIKTFNDLKELTGYDAAASTDLLHKTILLTTQENQEDSDKLLIKETAYVAYSFLGMKNKIRTDLMNSIESMSNYKDVYSEYSTKNPNLNPYKIKELIVVDFISDSIKNNWEVPKDSYINRKASYWKIEGNSKLEKQIKYKLAQIKRFIKSLLNIRLSEQEMNLLLDDIANDVLNSTMDKFGTVLNAEDQLVNYNDTIAKDDKANEIVNNFQKLGLLLTGSLSLRSQGTLYRTDKENLHDLDFTFTIDKRIEELIASFEDYNKDLIERYNIVNQSVEQKERIKENYLHGKIKELLEEGNLPLLQKIGEIYPDFQITSVFPGLKSNEFTLSGNIGDHIIDIFFVSNKDLDKNRSSFQDWENIFKAKLKMGRAKDIKDFANYVPFNSNNTRYSQEVGFRHFNFENIKSNKKSKPQSFSFDSVKYDHNKDIYTINEQMLRSEYEHKSFTHGYVNEDDSSDSIIREDEFDNFNEYAIFKFLKEKHRNDVTPIEREFDDASEQEDLTNQLALEKLNDLRFQKALESENEEDYKDDDNEIQYNKAETDALLSEIIGQSKDFQLTSDEKHYRDVKTGKLYERVTNFIGDGEEIATTDILEQAQKFGNHFDIFIRDYFDGTLDKDDEKHDFISEDDKEFLLSRLKDLSDYFKINGEVVISKDITLYNDELGVAGTVDLLTVNQNGEVSIYDIKTMRGDNFNQKNDEGFTKYYSRYKNRKTGKITLSSAKKHQKQLSAYAHFLEQYEKANVKVIKIGIIPIEIDYDKDSNHAEILDVNDILIHERITDPDKIKYNQDDYASMKNDILDSDTTKNIKQIINMKNALLELYKESLDNYKFKSSVNHKKTYEFTQTVHDYNVKIDALKHNIKELEEKSEDLLFALNDIATDIINIKKTLLDLPTDASVMEIRNEISIKLNTYSQLVRGLDLQGNYSTGLKLDISEYENEASFYKLLNDAIELYTAQGKEIIYHILNDDAFAQSIIETENEERRKFNEQFPGKTQKEIIDSLEEFFKNGVDDIKWLERYMLGIDANADLLTSQLSKITLEKEQQLEFQLREPLIDKLSDLDKILKSKKFNMEHFFEENYLGPTGNIIRSITKEWDADYNDVNKLSTDVKNGKTTTIGKATRNYKSKIEFLKDHAEVIDIRKIRSIVDRYKNTDRNIQSFFGTYTDAEIDAYENELKNLYGVDYQDMINHATSNIENYLLFRQSIKTNSDTKEEKKRKIDQANPFLFLEAYYSEDSTQPLYEHDGLNSRGKTISIPTYSSINNKYIAIFPKRHEEGSENYSYYNAEFDKNIRNDVDAYEYWKTLKDAYLNYISPSYKNEDNAKTSAYSYAKVKKTASEHLDDLNINYKNPYTSKFATTAKLIKALWERVKIFKEYSFKNEGDEVVSNYNDNTNKQIYDLIQKFNNIPYQEVLNLLKERNIDTQSVIDKNNQDLQEIDAEIATETKPKKIDALKLERQGIVDKLRTDISVLLARNIVLNRYSKDITAITQTLLKDSALHAGRKAALPKIEMFAELHKSVQNKENKDRKNSNNKLDDWIKAAVKNNRDGLGRDSKSTEFTKGIFQSVSSALEQFGVSKSTRESVGKALHRLVNDLDEHDKMMFDHWQNILAASEDGTVNNISFYDDVTGYNYSINKDGKLEAVNESGQKAPVTQEEYNRGLQRHIHQKIRELGTSQNIAGTLKMGAKISAIKSFFLNPDSGNKNRLAGVLFLERMDASGLYWTPGNDLHSRNLLAFANTLKRTTLIHNESIRNTKKYKNLQIAAALLDKFDLLQDKSSDYDRFKARGDDGILGKFSVFDFAINDPEYKNQLQMLLNKLQDVKIQDPMNPKGKPIPLFDGEKQEFAFEMFNGKLKLKDEYYKNSNPNDENSAFDDEIARVNKLNFIDFQLDKNERDRKKLMFFDTKLQVKRLITKQSNFDDNDVIPVTKYWQGQILLQFKKYLAEYLHLKFAKNADGLYNVLENKKHAKGTYTELAEENKSILASAALIQALLATGNLINPLKVINKVRGGSHGLGITALVTISAGLTYKVAQQKRIEKTLGNILFENAGFISKTMIETANASLRSIDTHFNTNLTINKHKRTKIYKNEHTEDVVNALSVELGQNINNTVWATIVLCTIFNLAMKTIKFAKPEDEDDEDDTTMKKLKNTSYKEFYSYVGNFMDSQVSDNALTASINLYTNTMGSLLELSQISGIKTLWNMAVFANDVSDEALHGWHTTTTKGVRSMSLIDRFQEIMLPKQISNFTTKGFIPVQSDFNQVQNRGYNVVIEDINNSGTKSQKTYINNELIKGDKSIKGILKPYIQDEYRKKGKNINKITGTTLNKILGKKFGIKFEKDFKTYQEYYDYMYELDKDEVKKKIKETYKVELAHGLKPENLTEGGKWSMVEEFEGPSHEQGGIDVTIKK